MTFVSERWPALMTLPEAARYLGVGVTAIVSLRGSGEITSVKVGQKSIRYRRVDLDRFVEQLPESVGSINLRTTD